MTPTQIFDKIVAHLLRKNAKSFDIRTHSCRYRGEQGRSCAVAMSEKKDRETVRQELIKAANQDRNDHLDREFLRSQGIHVEEPRITWNTVLEPKGMEGMGPALQGRCRYTRNQSTETLPPQGRRMKTFTTMVIEPYTYEKEYEAGPHYNGGWDDVEAKRFWGWDSDGKCWCWDTAEKEPEWVHVKTMDYPRPQ